MLVAVSGISLPSFWLDLLLIDWFSVWLGWFPTSGYGTLTHFVLPSINRVACIAHDEEFPPKPRPNRSSGGTRLSELDTSTVKSV
jgi:hypothetical protein